MAFFMFYQNEILCDFLFIFVQLIFWKSRLKNIKKNKNS